MRNYTVYIRHENGGIELVAVSAMGENAAVASVSAQGRGGTIYAVRDQWSTLPAPGA